MVSESDYLNAHKLACRLAKEDVENRFSNNSDYDEDDKRKFESIQRERHLIRILNIVYQR